MGSNQTLIEKKWLTRCSNSSVQTNEETEPEEEVIMIEVPENPIDFLQPLSQHQMEDAADLLSKSDGKGNNSTLQSLAGMIRDIERMIGTILNSHGGRWSQKEEELFLRIAVRRGWPVEDENDQHSSTCWSQVELLRQRALGCRFPRTWSNSC